MKMKEIGFYLIASCYLLLNTVDGVTVSLSSIPDQVQAGSTLSLKCSVDEDPAPLALVRYLRNSTATVVVSHVATCLKAAIGTDVYNLTCDPNNRWFKLDILNVDSNSHGDIWMCDMSSGVGGRCLGNPNPCVSGPVNVFIPVPVTTVCLTTNNGKRVTSPVDVSESSNGLTLKCNTGPTGSRPVADITWWKTGDYVSPERITANLTALAATSLGNDTYISNTRLVVGDRSYNGLKVYCTASQVTSREVQLNVKWRPDVSLQIGEQSYTVYKVLESQTNVVIKCTPGPVNPAITGYSLRHNSNVVNERTNTYTISSVSQSHDGVYTCSATNVEGTGTSSELDIDVLYEPTVDAMAAVFLEENESLYKTCTGRGNPTPSFHWTFGSQTPSNNAVLEIQRISSDQSGIYTCHVSNTLDPSVGPAVDKTTSTTLNVTIYYGPKSVNVSPLNLGIEEVQRTTTPAICSADCNPSCEYRWYKNGETHPVDVGKTLDLGIVNRNKAGNYTCEAQNRFLNRERSQRADVPVQVHIYYKPTITSLHIKGDDVISENHTDTTIVCEVDSYPAPRILWTRGHNHSSLPDTGNSLIIPRAQCSDTTLFTCTANNGIGLTVKQSVPLYVNCQPRINLQHQSEATVYGAIGESINVTVHDIIAYPPPTFTWNNVDTDRLPPSTQTDTNTSSTLTLHQLEQSTFGNYSVTMANNIGDPFIVYIAVESGSHPLEPTNLAVITSTSNSVTLTWTPGCNGGADQTFHIQYQKAGDVNFVNHSKTFLDDLSILMSGTIAGLQESTVYNFRLISRNRFGDSPVSEGVQRITANVAKPESIVGPVIGGAIGCVVVGALGMLAAIYLWRRYQERRTNSPATPERTEDQNDSTYQDLTQNRSASTSDYQALNLSEKATPGYLNPKLNVASASQNDPYYLTIIDN